MASGLAAAALASLTCRLALDEVHVSQQTDGIVRGAGILAALTLLSRVLGLVRDALCAALFGAGVTWDAFSFAFRVPNMLRRLLGEGALSAAFVPIFTRRLECGDSAEAERLAHKVLP